VNSQNKHGETPLHMAVFNPCIKIIMAELLLKNKGDPNIPTTSGDTCVHYCVDIGKVELIKLFIVYDANFDLIGHALILFLVLFNPFCFLESHI
jgi:ankyrin repeat protein